MTVNCQLGENSNREDFFTKTNGRMSGKIFRAKCSGIVFRGEIFWRRGGRTKKYSEELYFGELFWVVVMHVSLLFIEVNTQTHTYTDT